jgi:hypothetical protein
MDLVSLRMMAVSIGAIGLVAACGSSGTSAGNSFGFPPGAMVPDATAMDTGAAPVMTAAPTNTGNQSPPPAAEAGPPTCSFTGCMVDGDCTAPCGNGTWCCMAGTCFSPASGSCNTASDGGDEGGDDGSTAAPAPSM